MAWRSSGRTNDELVNNLKRFGVIRTPEIEAAFRAVDRKFFVPTKQSHLAYTDQPIREGSIHISAPHIYGTILEALDLPSTKAGSTFLNLGSGTGYLTCLVTQVMGPQTIAYNVELQDEPFRHGQQAVQQWQQESMQRRHPKMEFLQGNGLVLHPSEGEACMGFDRIYVGAALELEALQPVANLLRPNGVLVCPVGDELVKVTRLSRSETLTLDISSAANTFRLRPPLLNNSDFVTDIISGVRFTGMIDPTPSSRAPIIIPHRIWEPALHSYYSETFRTACRTVLLCANADPSRHPYAEASLPRALWLEVLTYTHRDWFELPLSEEDQLRLRLRHLEATLRQTEQAKRDLEDQLRLAHEERDLHRRMAQYMQQVLGSSSTRRVMLAAELDENDDLDEVVDETMAEDDDDDDDDDDIDDDDDDEEEEEEEDDSDDDDEMEEGAIVSGVLSTAQAERLRTHRTVSIGSEHA